MTRFRAARFSSLDNSEFVVADVPSESHSYCVESSTSLPDVRPLPMELAEKVLPVVDGVRER